jgi:hypothetical protein
MARYMARRQGLYQRKIFDNDTGTWRCSIALNAKKIESRVLVQYLVRSALKGVQLSVAAVGKASEQTPDSDPQGRMTKSVGAVGEYASFYLTCRSAPPCAPDAIAPDRRAFGLGLFTRGVQAGDIYDARCYFDGRVSSVSIASSAGSAPLCRAREQTVLGHGTADTRGRSIRCPEGQRFRQRPLMTMWPRKSIRLCRLCAG